MKYLVFLLSLCYTTFLYAQSYAGYGRGMDFEDENPFTQEQMLWFLPVGIVLIGIGVFLRYLYSNKYDDKEWLKNMSFGFKILGGMFLLSFVCSFLIFTLVGIVVIIIVSYFLYSLFKMKNPFNGDAVNGFVNAFVNCISKMGKIIKGDD